MHLLCGGSQYRRLSAPDAFSAIFPTHYPPLLRCACLRLAGLAWLGEVWDWLGPCVRLIGGGTTLAVLTAGQWCLGCPWGDCRGAVVWPAGLEMLPQFQSAQGEQACGRQMLHRGVQACHRQQWHLQYIDTGS